ncbi:MAG: glycosyltransferase family 4 protein [Methyloceanibacter sp.]
MSTSLRILHCLRAPIGGLFRRVHDLAKGQAELGLQVGVVSDSETGGQEVVRALGRLADSCTLGVTRCPMPRQIGLGDWRGYRQVKRLASSLGVDVLHGHGAKGGAYARLAARALKRKGTRVGAFYTPHGGSLHYSPATLTGRLYIQAERWLAPLTEGIIFESVFAARRYSELIGEPPCAVCIVPNGLYRHEFYEAMLADNAADFVFVGELRQLKGVDILLAALAAQRTVYPATAVIVGSGPDEKDFHRLAQKLGLDGKVSFAGSLPARTALARGRCVVVPSRAESFPYVVLEAAAAQMPLIATDAGGIPEIVAGTDTPLVRAGDIAALAAQMRAFLANPKPFLDRAARLQAHVAKRLTVERMTNEIVEFYLSALGDAPTPKAPSART